MKQCPYLKDVKNDDPENTIDTYTCELSNREMNAGELRVKYVCLTECYEICPIYREHT